MTSACAAVMLLGPKITVQCILHNVKHYIKQKNHVKKGIVIPVKTDGTAFAVASLSARRASLLGSEMEYH